MNKNITKADIFDWCLQQAALIVSAYRVEGLKAFNQSFQTHSATTPEQHRKTLIATLSNPNPRVREQAEAELAQLERDRAHGIQQGQFGIQQAGLEENRQQRRETATANRESRELYQRGLEDTRAERTALAQEAQSARRAQGLQLAMNDPNLSKEERAAAKSQYLNTLGVQAAPNAAGTQKGAYGPGGAPATPNTPAPAGGGAYTQPTAAFTGAGAPPPTTGGKAYAAPQDLSPPPGSSPAAYERAFDLKQAVARGEATTGELPTSPLANPAFANAGPATYAPDLAANVVTNQAGERMVVGAPDTSVGALKGSQIADLGRSARGNNMYELTTPSGGTIKSTYKGNFADYAAAHPQYRNVTGQTPGQIAGREASPNPPPAEAAYPGSPAPPFVPPTAAFAATPPAAQPTGAPTPGPINAPAKVQVGFGGGPPVDVATIGYTGGMSNAAQDAAARGAAPLAPTPGSNQAMDAAAAAAAQKLQVMKQPPLVPPPKKKDQT